MTSLRSSEVDFLLTRKKLVGNVLPTNQEVIQHYYHVRQFLIDTEPKFSRIPPGFNDIKELVMSDVVELWRKASLTVIEAKSIQKKLKNIHDKFACARKRTKKSKRTVINEDWFFKLYRAKKRNCCFTVSIFSVIQLFLQ